MNYVEVAVSFNTKNIYTLVKNDSPVTLADKSEIELALGLDKIKNKLVCGFLKMYEGHADREITLPVNLDAQFLLGSEGAHLNISGISGLAAKTSYAMFLMKSVQENFDDCAFVIFNVKGKDLLALHKADTEVPALIYRDLGLSGKPFVNVRYFAPRNADTDKVTTYLPQVDVENYFAAGLLNKFVYVYTEDRESLEMLFADVDDTTQTMDSIISKVVDPTDADFGGISSWRNFLAKVNELSQRGNSKEISVLSWRKFKRIVNKAIKTDAMFVDREIPQNRECRLEDALKKISAGSVSVIDIAKLGSDKQAFVFGDVQENFSVWRNCDPSAAKLHFARSRQCKHIEGGGFMFVPDINMGINLVEIVTSGLYTNSLDALREYVQNSCDAIDDAVRGGTLDQDESRITINIDVNKRRITIEDNGTGISTRDFMRVMNNIGHSDKSLETDRGFRGIGRLGGLAFCKTLVFSSKVAGEKKISTLTITAEKLRKEFSSDKKRPAEYALAANMRFDQLDTHNVANHFFRVEMIDIVKTNEALLNVTKVREYLSFVAPVPYATQFEFRKQIRAYAASLNFHITEYDIRVNGKSVVKNYKTEIQTARKGRDKIFDVEFREVRDADKKLIAWFWFGLSTFKGVLSETHSNPSYKMRGIRLRQKNIQIGDALILRTVFQEEQRGTKYFIGEVHTIDTNLRPNSERDNFEENTAYNNLKAALRHCFFELNDLYHNVANVRTLQNTVAKPEKIKREFQSGRSKLKNQEEFYDELARLNEDAAKARNKIDYIIWEANIAPDAVMSKVTRRVLENPTPVESRKVKTFPPLNWSEESRERYNKVKEVILDNPSIGGKKLLDKIIKALSK